MSSKSPNDQKGIAIKRYNKVISDKEGRQLEVYDPFDLHPAIFSQHCCPKFDAKMPDLTDQCKQLKAATTKTFIQ